MCGRYTEIASDDELIEHFDIEQAPPREPRYNIAPTQDAPIVCLNRDGQRRMAMHRWGLIPFWADDAKIGARLINARSETVAETPAFRDAFRGRRCLVPTSGFYEWRRLDAKTKRPYFIRLREPAPFAFAGLRARWQSPDGPAIRSYTILTTTPNAVMAPLHDRMPVIIHPADYALWLDPDAPPGALLDLLRPAPDDALEAYGVSPRVNRPAVDNAPRETLAGIPGPPRTFSPQPPCRPSPCPSRPTAPPPNAEPNRGRPLRPGCGAFRSGSGGPSS